MTTTSKQHAQRKARRKKYAQNIFAERRQAKERARVKKELRTPKETMEFLERHRSAQARYRASRREELALKAREYRRNKADARERERDAELLAEFEGMMAEGDEDPTFEEAARRLTKKTGKRYKLSKL